MTLGSVATSGLLVGGMSLGLYLTGPADSNHETVPQLVIIGVTMLLGCWFPLWVPYKIEDYIDGR
jgi:hypothetical protein